MSPKRANISYILKYFAPEEIMPLLSLLPEEGVAPVVEVPPLGHPLHLPVRWVCSKYVLSLPSTYNFDEVGEFSGGRSLYSGHRKELGSSQFTMKIQHSINFFFGVLYIIWIDCISISSWRTFQVSLAAWQWSTNAVNVVNVLILYLRLLFTRRECTAHTPKAWKARRKFHCKNGWSKA